MSPQKDPKGIVQIQNPNPLNFRQKSWLEVLVVHPDWFMPGEDILCLFVVSPCCCSHDYWKHFLSMLSLIALWMVVWCIMMLKLWVSLEPQSKYQMDLLWFTVVRRGQNGFRPCTERCKAIGHPPKKQELSCITSCDCAPGAVLLRVITAKVAEAIHCFWRFLANFAHRYDSIDSRPICHKSVPPRKKAHLQLPTPADMAPKRLFNMTKKQQRSKHVLPTKGDLSFTILYQTLGISKVAIVIDFDGALFGITVCCFSPIPWGMLDVCVCSVMSWIICVAWAVCVCNIILGRLWVYDITYNINLSYVMFIIHYNTLSLFFIRFQSWPMRSCHSGRKNVPTLFFWGNGLRVLMWSNGPWLARSRHSLEPSKLLKSKTPKLISMMSCL